MHPKFIQRTLDILQLRNEYMTICMPNLYTKTMMENSQICHIKSLAQILFDLVDQMCCTTGNDEIINIDDKKKNFTTGMLDIQIGIGRTPLKALIN